MINQHFIIYNFSILLSLKQACPKHIGIHLSDLTILFILKNLVTTDTDLLLHCVHQHCH